MPKTLKNKTVSNNPLAYSTYSYVKLRKYWYSINQIATYPVDGFFETVTSTSIHLHKSKAIVIPRVDNRWQHALRHSIWRSNLKHKMTQTKNLMICNSQVGQLTESKAKTAQCQLAPLKCYVIYMHYQVPQEQVWKQVALTC